MELLNYVKFVVLSFLIYNEAFNNLRTCYILAFFSLHHTMLMQKIDVYVSHVVLNASKSS